VTFVFSVTLHEAAHAWIAKLGGDLTAYYGGQVSIDPVPHIKREPIGMVVLPILSLILSRGSWPFGYASAPYDPYWAMRYPKRSAYMALAGPAANLLVAVVAGVLIRVGCGFGVFGYPGGIFGYTAVTLATQEGFWVVAALLLSMLFSLNLILAVLNLIPVPPLDGSGVLPLFLNNETTLRYRHLMNQPAFMWMGIIIAWNVFDHIFHPVFLAAFSLLYAGVK
jgi:Zn-dependent protease